MTLTEQQFALLCDYVDATAYHTAQLIVRGTGTAEMQDRTKSLLRNALCGTHDPKEDARTIAALNHISNDNGSVVMVPRIGQLFHLGNQITARILTSGVVEVSYPHTGKVFLHRDSSAKALFYTLKAYLGL